MPKKIKDKFDDTIQVEEAVKAALELMEVKGPILYGQFDKDRKKFSGEIPINECGIYMFAASCIELDIKFFEDKQMNCWIGRPSFSYTHHSRGSNGCDLNFYLMLINGKWVIQEDKRWV